MYFINLLAEAIIIYGFINLSLTLITIMIVFIQKYRSKTKPSYNKKYKQYLLDWKIKNEIPQKR